MRVKASRPGRYYGFKEAEMTIQNNLAQFRLKRGLTAIAL